MERLPTCAASSSSDASFWIAEPLVLSAMRRTGPAASCSPEGKGAMCKDDVQVTSKLANKLSIIRTYRNDQILRLGAEVGDSEAHREGAIEQHGRLAAHREEKVSALGRRPAQAIV